MKNNTTLLNALASCFEVIEKSKESKLLGGLFSSFYINKENKTKEELEEILSWFLDGGEFSSYWKESSPYGERKNSKKRQKTTWFFAKKKGIDFQLGHITASNYSKDFWEMGAEMLVKSALCKEGEFSYHNNSFVDYVLKKGATFKDLGEKKQILQALK
jgi:hypothetical protein